MIRPIYVSTNCLADRSPTELVAATRTEGWKYVEFSAIQASRVEAIALCRRLRAWGVKVLLHNYFPPPEVPFVMNLASTDPDVLFSSRQMCEQAIRLSSEFCSPFFAAHAGFSLDLPPELLGDPVRQREFCNTHRCDRSAREARKVFAESVALLTEFAGHHGVQFLIENHVAGAALGVEGAEALLLCLHDEDWVALAKEIGEMKFGMLLDVGHLNCTSMVVKFSRTTFIETVGSWIKAFHLSDNDGSADQHKPFGPDAWFLSPVAAMPEAPVTLEFDRCTLCEIAEAKKIIYTL